MNFIPGPDKLLVIALIAVVLVGPERLPRYAEGLARLIKKAGEVIRGVKDRAAEEMGPEFTETDWRKLDPRQYDPRRIIREALLDDVMAPAPTAAVATAGAAAAATSASATPPSPHSSGASALFTRSTPRTSNRLAAGEIPPYDAEAT
ncbi:MULTISPECIES: Sec-independent protein translocase TatB [Microbacterium]|uniref:Sec-independent protein translocase TatB n=1 Tax=Microbacterium TaxID=33882 RepID=UPI001E3059F6|nr:Sec-independent protein translocase TatB [Microbacterium nymphoidis]MCD2496934.1 Sec-independent protein translocase TatB [Microbacterium nymphoidis]